MSERYLVTFTQLFQGEEIVGSYTRTIKDDREKEDIRNRLFEDDHVISVEFRRVENLPELNTYAEEAKR